MGILRTAPTERRTQGCILLLRLPPWLVLRQSQRLIHVLLRGRLLREVPTALAGEQARQGAPTALAVALGLEAVRGASHSSMLMLPGGHTAWKPTSPGGMSAESQSARLHWPGQGGWWPGFERLHTGPLMGLSADRLCVRLPSVLPSLQDLWKAKWWVIRLVQFGWTVTMCRASKYPLHGQR